MEEGGGVNRQYSAFLNLSMCGKCKDGTSSHSRGGFHAKTKGTQTVLSLFWLRVESLIQYWPWQFEHSTRSGGEKNNKGSRRALASRNQQRWHHKGT